MNPKNYYVIDSSSLIHLNMHYPINVFPGVWKKLEELVNRGLLVSPKEVLKEISQKDDSLKRWAGKNKAMFRDLDEKQIKIAMGILAKYPPLAKSDSENIAADPFVIALAIEIEKDSKQALFHDMRKNIIVTEEKLVRDRIRIPFVCREYGIECIELLQLFEKEGWKFD
jgi:hypothetical protein